MNIYIGNFCENISQDHLRERLEEFGMVESIKIENKIAFAEMPLENEAESAIVHLDNSELDGITISVHKARFGHTDRRKSGRIGGRRSQDPKSYSRMFSRKDMFI
jgi:RNA recognition motif-containing protein